MGAGIVSKIVWNNGLRFVPGALRSSVAVPARLDV